MALSYKLGYQEGISVHPTRRQIFAGKPYSTLWNIWEWVICSCSNYLEHILVVAIGGEFVPVVAKGEFSDAPGSIYRSILSSCRYYLEDFDYRSILVNSGTIVHWCKNKNRWIKRYKNKVMSIQQFKNKNRWIKHIQQGYDDTVV